MKATDVDAYPETRVLAIAMAPNRELCAHRHVRRWIANIRERRHDTMPHPLTTRVVGVAVATLVVSEDGVILADLDAEVGDERLALGLICRQFGPSEGQVVTYISEPGGFETVWFRMLMRHAFSPVLEGENRWHWRNIANTFSLDERFASPPIEVALSGLGIEPWDALCEHKLRGTCEKGAWQEVTRILVNRLNATAAIYCSLAGLSAGVFRAATVQGL